MNIATNDSANDTATNEDGPPIAKVLSVKTTDDTRLVEVACLLGCRRGRHIHGWPFGETSIGERQAHCGGEAREYFVPTPDVETSRRTMRLVSVDDIAPEITNGEGK